jgi:hypothetical protein
MAVNPDDYLIMETFLRGIPESLCQPIINDGLSPEVNTINDFMAQAKWYEYAKKTLDYYNHLTAVCLSTEMREVPLSSTKKT